ncbi:MAG: aminodeoxychorismate/anthranilate synthase component II [Clostridiales bacterium]|jgi:anthranilate synthase component 2|nr:aminodeoxychorismate/anthranilate synthase component II [Clostridiales bacterium]
MILIIDNYDSFTYNLYQAAGAFNPDVEVIKNAELGIDEIEAKSPTHIIISPGPGRPKDAGVCEQVVLRFKGRLPILGICLGHQAICEAFDAKIGYADTLMHGKKSAVHIANGSPVFRGLPPVINGARYHSLSVVRQTLPDELLVIAEDESGEVMAVAHRDFDIFGLQFHPESILTEYGAEIINNFLMMGSEGK